MNTKEGYSKTSLTDLRVLLAGGGDKALTEFRTRASDGSINPIKTITCTDSSYYGSSWLDCDLYFGLVRPLTYYSPWRVRVRIETTISGYSNYHSVTWSEIYGRANSPIIHNFNEVYNSAHEYTCVRMINSITGFGCGAGCAIGVSIMSSSNYTSSKYPRTFKISLYDCDNCTVTMFDKCYKFANMSSLLGFTYTGTASYKGTWANGTSYVVGDIVYSAVATTYGRYYLCKTAHTSSSSATYTSSNWENIYTDPSHFDAVNRGLLESGDSNDGNYNHRELRMRPYAETLMYRYKIYGLTKQNRAVPLVTTNLTSLTIVAKSTNTTAFCASKGLFYYNSTTDIAAGSVLSENTSYKAITTDTNCTYTFNANIPAYSFVYIKGSYDSTTDEFKINSGTSISDSTWYVCLPTNSVVSDYTTYFTSGNYYILAGCTNLNTNGFHLLMDNPIYYFDGTNLKPVSGGSSGDYLPLSGGTLTGEVYFTDDNGLEFGSDSSGNLAEGYMYYNTEGDYLEVDSEGDIIFSNKDSNGDSYTLTMPTKTGTIALVSDITKSLVGLGSVDNLGKNNYTLVKNSSSINSGSNSYTVNQLAAAGNSTVGMIYSATDSPVGSGWFHVWSQAWTNGSNTSWVSQIAAGTQNSDGLYYRTSLETIVGAAWKRILDSSNYNTLITALDLTTLTVTGSATFQSSIIGNLNGNATTADKLKTSRTISVGSTSLTFDGSQNLSFSVASEYAKAIRDPTYHTLSSRYSSMNLNFADGALHYFLATSSCSVGKPPLDGNVLHLSWDNGSWESQLAILNDNRGLWYRGMNGSLWMNWNIVYTEVPGPGYNYNSNLTGLSTFSSNTWSSGSWMYDWYYTMNSSRNGIDSRAVTYSTTDTCYVNSVGASTDTGGLWLFNVIRWFCSKYKNSSNTIARGTYNIWNRPGSEASIVIHIYSSCSVNSDNIPLYAWGTFHLFGSLNMYTFQFNNYVFSGAESRSYYATTSGNADTVDGYHASATKQSDSWFSRVAPVGGDGVMEVGRYIDFHTSSSGTTDYDFRIEGDSGSAYLSGPVYFHKNDNNSHLPSHFYHRMYSDSDHAVYEHFYDTTFNSSSGANYSNNSGVNFRVWNGSGHLVYTMHYDGSGSLTVDGSLTITGSYYANSDIRYKNVIEDVKLTAEQISSIRTFKYNWTDSKHDNKLLHVGGSALEIMKIIPEAVNYDSTTDFYSLDYASSAFVMVKNLADEVVKLKERIKELEDGKFNSNRS